MTISFGSLIEGGHPELIITRDRKRFIQTEQYQVYFK